MNRTEQALHCYNLALAIEPDYAEALDNRGNALLDLKRPEQALDNCHLALIIRPEFTEALDNRGIALLELRHPELALHDSYDLALAINPSFCRGAEQSRQRFLNLNALNRHYTTTAWLWR